jgi:hypothetical protein
VAEVGAVSDLEPGIAYDPAACHVTELVPRPGIPVRIPPRWRPFFD